MSAGTYVIDYALVDGNHPPDCHAAKAAGASIVGIRGAWGYRGKASIDPTFLRDAAAWRDAGVRVFAYLFLDFETDIAAQVDALTSSYVRQDADLPVAIDLEMDAAPPGTTAQTRLFAAQMALARLQAHYGKSAVMAYTSAAQWVDHFGDFDSISMDTAPLWLKTPYAWNPRNAPHLDSCGPLGELPRPWRSVGGPGAFLQQFQGDAIGWPGMSSTVDVSRFLTFTATDTSDDRRFWVAQHVGCRAQDLHTALPIWQKAHNLIPDGIVGPATFAELCT